MQNRQIMGKRGEDLAVRWLKDAGYQVLHRNWRFGRYEMDVIACKGNVLHFIEVKTRRSSKFGWPEEYVNAKKIARMLAVMEAYLQSQAAHELTQVDILSIVLPDRGSPVFFLIEDVFL